MIFTLVLVGVFLLLLGWKVPEKEHLSEKLQELQKPSTEFVVSKSHPRAPETKSSARSAVEERALEKATPEERLKSRRLRCYVDYVRKNVNRPILPDDEFSEKLRG